MTETRGRLRQGWVGLALLLVAFVMGIGAWGIPSEAGYAGVGPNFLPWVVAAALALCALMLLQEVRTGGMRQMPPPSGAEGADVPGFLWLSAGLILNALLLTSLGFILSCSLCFVLAVHGLRSAEGQGGLHVGRVARDLLTGLCIAAPVYWMFTKLLAINLPGLTNTGWI